MTSKRMIVLAAIALLPIAAGAATFVVPAAGTGAGAGGSQWQTELTLHSTSSFAIPVTLTFHDQNGAGETATVQLAPRSTVAIADIVKSRFGRQGGTGAIEIVVDDPFAAKVAITSRTFNSSESGEFGQDIPAVKLESAFTPGQVVVLSAPSNVAGYRFNAGIYAAKEASIRWDLVRADGTVTKSLTVDYAAGTQTQYNGIVEALFAENAADSDTLAAVVLKGAVLAYGSAVNNATGDPTFVPGIATLAETHIQFIGVDADLDGNAEILDGNRDGVLDGPMNIIASSPIPNSFKLLVSGANNPRFELVEANPDIYITPDGVVVWTPSSTAVEVLKIRVTTDDAVDVLTIPIKFL